MRLKTSNGSKLVDYTAEGVQQYQVMEQPVVLILTFIVMGLERRIAQETLWVVELAQGLILEVVNLVGVGMIVHKRTHTPSWVSNLMEILVINQ